MKNLHNKKIFTIMKIQAFNKAVFIISIPIIIGLSGCEKEFSCEGCLKT